MKRKEYSILDFKTSAVWSYTRVSSKEQFISNGSIGSQVKRIKSFANENQLIISKEFDAEYESSKRINTQKTLNELIDAIKNTTATKRPKMILIWSPSRFGRAGSEHIELFVSLRRKYNVLLYSVSTGHNTFTERNENEFSLQLLHAQKENFSRQDVIIPGMKDAIEKGTFLGRAPRGYDHFGPRVKDPTKVQAHQKIKLNTDGLLLKKAFKLKLYNNYSDKEILDWLLLEGLKVPKQSLNAMWKMVFYTGYFTNSLVPGVEIKGHWEPIISRKEFKLLQSRLSNSNQIGIPKINGKTSTPLVPKFLICAECDNTMTSYLNKAKRIYYYKCGKCNKTANANTRPKSINDGLNQQFRKSVDSLQFSKSFHKLFSKQLEKIIDTEMSATSEKKRILKTEVNDLQQTYDDMEYRFAIGKISQEIFDKHAPKLKTQIDEKSKQLLNLPSKKSNHQKFLKKFLKIAENPGKFYESLNYNDKRVFQNIVFPKGFMFSLKSKECRTSKMNMIFDLTNSFKDAYNVEIKKTQIQKVLESRLVAGIGLEPMTFGL
jgi:site-specific DNA recombinase